MAINITDSGSTVKLELTTGYSREGYNAIPAQVVYLSKSELDVKYIGQDIIIYDTGNSYKFLYTDITTPSPVTYTTPDAMAGAIDAFNGGTETPTAQTAVDSSLSPITAGKKCITFTTNASFVGTILGATRNASTTYRIQVVNPSATLSAVAFTVTAGSMTIDVQS